MPHAYRIFKAHVARRQALTPTFTRVTLGGGGLSQFGSACLDQRVKLVLPLPGANRYASFPHGEGWYADWRALPAQQRNPLRTVTVKAVRPESCEVDVDIALHGELGPLSRWAASCLPGEDVVLVGPDRQVAESDTVGIEWRPGNATQVLLVGDETAVPAIASILGQCGPAMVGEAYLEVPLGADRLPVQCPPGIRVHWLVRGARPHGDPLVEAVTGSVARRDGPDEEVLWDVHGPDAARFAWVAGEATAVRAIRRHLVAHGWDKQHVAFMGYWRQGRAEA